MPITDAERADILEREIDRHVRAGYRVVSRTAATAQLVRPKTFDVALAIIGLLFLVVGLLIYLLIYASRSDDTLYLSILEDGTVQRHGNAAVSRSGWVCDACGHQNHGARSICKRCKVPLAA